MKKLVLILILVTQYSYAASDIEITCFKDSQKILTVDLFFTSIAEMGGGKVEGYLTREGATSNRALSVLVEWKHEESPSMVSIQEKEDGSLNPRVELQLNQNYWQQNDEFEAHFNGKAVRCRFRQPEQQPCCV